MTNYNDQIVAVLCDNYDAGWRWMCENIAKSEYVVKNINMFRAINGTRYFLVTEPTRLIGLELSSYIALFNPREELIEQAKLRLRCRRNVNKRKRKNGES